MPYLNPVPIREVHDRWIAPHREPIVAGLVALRDLAEEELPLRVGVSFGEVLTREGDFYGPVVNLAARITKLAPPNGLLTTMEATRTLTDPDRFTINSLGAIATRGLTQPVELATLVS